MREPDTAALNVTSTPDWVRLPDEAVRPANWTSARKWSVSSLPDEGGVQVLQGFLLHPALARRFPAR